MSKTSTAILQDVVAIAREVPPAVLESLCQDLEKMQLNLPEGERMAMVAQFTQPSMRHALSKLIKTWNAEAPHLSPVKLAWALRGASAMDESWRHGQSLELAWTGPLPSDSHFRRTDQAFLDLIEGAQVSVIMVTFVAYKIQEIASALLRAAKRGVQIMLILESAEASAGKVEYEALRGIGRQVAEASNVYVWPQDQRPRGAADRYGTLHAKCAIADANTLFISSANLTENALNLNMEMGILIRDGVLPAQADHHFRELIAQGVLSQVK